MLKFKKAFYIILGCISLGLGTVGLLLPVLPTVLFFMLAAFCFAKSSKKLHTWFINTELYKKNLESYVNGNGMTVTAKIRIMGMVTCLMMFGFVMMMSKASYIPCMILAAVWVFHIFYFVFAVKTMK